MNRGEILLGLHTLDGIGWKTLQKLADSPQLQQIPIMKAKEIQSSFGVDAKRANLIATKLTNLHIEQVMEKLEAEQIGWTAYGDPSYPSLLVETPWPPWVLYYKGDLELVKGMCIAVVGTRVPTTYGRRIAEQISEQLAARGVCVISGLARGIDSHAHQGALKEKGRTVAVMATPLNKVYPPENRSLFSRISEEGLLLSEAPLGTTLRPGLFPLRNRIIAGLSRGTLVVEGEESSGSLITAFFGQAANREIFAVPGPISSPKSAGPLSLIYDGGKIVRKVDDILEEFQLWSKYNCVNQQLNQPLMMSEDEQKVLSFMREEPTTIDELLALSKFRFGHLHSVLLSLSMKQKIEQLPGSQYCLVVEI